MHITALSRWTREILNAMAAGAVLQTELSLSFREISRL